jgi:hypothetical protein
MNHPDASEYAPYFAKYVSLVPEGAIVETLAGQAQVTLALIAGLTGEQGDHRYAPGKWSLKEVLGHINDTERIMAYRALRIARGDRTPLPGFEQDGYIPNSPAAHMSLADLAEEFGAIRRATLTLFRALDDAAWQRRGTASENEVTVRALAYIIAGHELHHMKIVRERYLG